MSRPTPAEARPTLSVALLQRFLVEAGEQLRKLREREIEQPTVASGLAIQLAPEQAAADTAAATLHSQVLTQGAPDAELLEASALDAAMVTFRAQLGNLQHALSALRTWVEAADPGVVASVAAVCSWEAALLPNHLASAIGALQYVDDGLARHSRVAINARWDALPPSDMRELVRQFELRASRRAALEAAQEGFAGVVRRHQLDGERLRRAGETVSDAHIRALLAVIAALVAATSGEGDAVAGDAGAEAPAEAHAVSTTGTARSRRLHGDGG